MTEFPNNGHEAIVSEAAHLNAPRLCHAKTTPSLLRYISAEIRHDVL